MWWKRIKKKQIEAGILLYALFMSAVFSLLLQFYLNRQVAERRILLASQHRIQAYAQAQLAIDTWDREEKTITFSTGRVDLGEATISPLLYLLGKRKKPTRRKRRSRLQIRLQITRPQQRKRSLRSSKSIAKTLKI